MKKRTAEPRTFRVTVNYLDLPDWKERFWRAACAIAPELRTDLDDDVVPAETAEPEDEGPKAA